MSHAVHPAGGEDYQPFGNVEARNGLQEVLEIPLLTRLLRLPRGKRVLEVGCGRGVALPVLAKRLAPLSLTGIDVDPALVAIARARMASARLDARIIEGDLRSMPFADGTFDVVIDFGTCYHVSGGRAGALAAMREIARVLVPGGLFVHETSAAQHLAHPVRSFGRTLPWGSAPGFVRQRSAVLWSVRRWIG
jgi:SAM-dependent methyltransferase